MPKNASAVSTPVLSVFRLAALFTFLAVAMGAVVCATGSGPPAPRGRVAVQTKSPPSGR